MGLYTALCEILHCTIFSAKYAEVYNQYLYYYYMSRKSSRSSSGFNLPIVIGSVLIGIFIVFIAFRQRDGGPSTSLHQITGAGQEAANIRQATSPGTEQAAFAPDFSLRSLDGRTVSLSDYRGVKPVVLDFFATWCPNCRRDMPKLSRLYQKYGDQVEVLGINLNEREGKVKKFIESRGIDFPILMDPSGQVARLYNIVYTNVHVLIAKDGTVKQVIPGDMYEGALQTLLN